MAPDIKDRSYKIFNAEIPEGYKATKAGVIPLDWKDMKLSKVLENARLGGNYENDSEKGGIPLIKMGNIGRGNIVLQELYYIKTEELNSEDLLKKGDLLFNTRNTLDLVGKVAIWKNELPEAYYNSNLLRLDFKEEFVSSNYFMNHQFNSFKMIRSLRRIATGTTSVAAIYTRDLMNCYIAIPPLPEQKKIAEILSNWDKAIMLKEQLIEEKKQQKTALMKKLLTGEVRLPGFEGEWEEVRIGKVLKERVETKCNDLELLAITSKNGIVKRTEVDIKDNSNDDKSKYKRICPLDIGYNTMRMWQGVSSVSEYEGIVSPAYTILTPTEKVDSYFMGYLFKEPKMVNIFWRHSQGMVDDTLNLKYSNLKTIKVIIPKDVKEQRAIAHLLKIIDKNIEFLGSELEALKLQKKGLMQLLLTGIVRVQC